MNRPIIIERIWNAIETLAQERVEIEKTGFFELWQIKNRFVEIPDITGYLDRQETLGFSDDDISVEAYLSTHSAWYSYISYHAKNDINGSMEFNSGRSVKFKGKGEFTKDQLLEAMAPEMEMIHQNRLTYLDNEDNAREFIQAGKFYQNNLTKMFFDQETHDFLLSVLKKMEQQKKDAVQAGKEKLRQWALENGSRTLKARIEDGFNWFDLAHEEYFLHMLPEDFRFQGEYDTDECWDYNNPTLQHILTLRSVRNTFPGAKLMKCRETITEDDQHDGSVDKRFYYFVADKLIAPTGRTRDIVMLIDQEDISVEQE